AELVIATDPALFTRKEGRTSSTFYTSREDGLLAIPRGEAVFMVPPAVLARFAGASRLTNNSVPRKTSSSSSSGSLPILNASA
ncbi:hypothetical protein, partial [Paraburkholderia sp. SIMBA_027]|uniref:hypothetical protein n=1 Tax=Paraburkholderia sp. SIMBA_027 TaxID=3085770 RepID=UPI00397D244D